jgi:nitrogen regulatory protein P-II 2
MNLHAMKLVTIIAEALLEEPVIAVLEQCGAHGHTAFTVRGAGHQGRREADLVESANVQIEVIVQPDVAETLLTRLREQFFDDFAMIAYETDVRVIRPGKF